MEFRLYIVNATEYGKGNEVGTWFDLPFKYPIDEYTSLEYLNSLANSLAEINCKGDLEWVGAYMEATGDSLEATLDSYENHSTFYTGQTLANVAWALAQSYFNAYKVPECVSRYFDYDALEADLEQEGYYEAEGGVIDVY